MDGPRERNTERTEEAEYSFGYWLRRRRKALDLTQDQLARAVSCSRHAIRKIEADERRPSRHLAERLAAKLAIAGEEREAFLEAARAIRGAAQLDLSRTPVSPARGGARESPPEPFVGRRREYALLRAALESLASARGSVFLIQGEAGVGKSRLMAELAREARTQGVPTLHARCYEIEQAMAYQPVIDLVTQAIAPAPAAALAQLPPVSLAEIAALVPAVATHIPIPSLSTDFPEARQARLLRAVGELFAALAASRPLGVIVDDVQWADDASARFLHYFARQAERSPLFVLLAYRDEDLGVNGRLAALVESLSREPYVRRVALARLSLADTEA
jgi:transcriptional regulator with XRE-family HTH domain